ncbi:MAG: cellulase family glycosylhydrolase [Candidatus Zhuqueibacterota bacterium]
MKQARRANRSFGMFILNDALFGNIRSNPFSALDKYPARSCGYLTMKGDTSSTMVLKKNLRFALFVLFLIFPFIARGQNASSLYGFQTHFGQFYRADMDSAHREQMLDLVQHAGFAMIRDECYWAEVETQPGVYAFPAAIDDYVDAAKRRGIDVLLILNYNNPLYAAHAGSAVTSDSNRAAFARYCRQAVQRYRLRGVTHYEIWNEPNNPQFWDPQPDAADYAALLHVVYPAIKAVDSTVTVIAGAMSPAEGNPPPYIDWLTFISRVYQHGGAEFLDAVSFHYYSVDVAPESKFLNDVQKLQAIVGEDTPFWLTEFGYPTHSGWPNITVQKQANYAARLFLLGKSVKSLQRIFFYDLKNDGENPADAEHNFGALNFDMTPKPAYHALKGLATTVADLPAESLEFGNNVYRAYFASDSAWVTAAWRAAGESEETVPIPGSEYGLIDRDGARVGYGITNQNQVTLRLSEQPQYLTSLPAAPALVALQVLPEKAILFPGQTAPLVITATAADGLPVSFSESVVNVRLEGDGGRLDGEAFLAEAPGRAKIIADYRGLADTAIVDVVPPGNIRMDDFSDLTGWQVDVMNLDSSGTFIRRCDSLASEGGSSARLAYRFVYKSGIHKSKYQVHLLHRIPVPGAPDTLLIDVRGNGQPIRFEFYFENIRGDEIKESAFDQPATWQDEWRPVKILAQKFIGKIEFPIFLSKIVVYIVQDGAVNDSTYHGEIFLDNLRVSLEGAAAAPASLPESLKFQLHQNYPNPFNPNTTVRYSVASDSHVTLSILNLLGQRVCTLVDDWRAAGEYQVQFDAAAFAAGMYVYRLDAGELRQIRKMIILK